jgi:hypothetical protein
LRQEISGNPEMRCVLDWREKYNCNKKNFGSGQGDQLGRIFARLKYFYVFLENLMKRT